MANFQGQEPEKVMPQGMGQMDPEQAAKDPKVRQVFQQAQGYQTVLINLIHGKQTRDGVIDMLKSHPDPLVVIPQAAITINDMGLMTMEQGGIKVDPSVQLVASQLLLNDLIELGQACGAFEQVPENEVEAIIEDTYQYYIEKGLKDKTIDPIQLQLEVEQLMNEEQVAGGLAMGHGQVPQQPDQRAIQQQQVDSEVHRAVSKQKASAAKKQAMEKQSALQGALVQQATQGGR